MGRAHGLDGSFHVTRPQPGALAVGVETSIGRIVRCDGTEQRPVVRVDGVEDRPAAEALRGTPILAALDLGDDEFWAEDLIGLRVTDGEIEVGTVERVRAYPSCEVLEVRVTSTADPNLRGSEGETLLVPLVSDAVRDVDLEAGRIDVDLEFLGAG